MTVQAVDTAFRKKTESNVKLYAIRKKIEAGTATMEDMAEYSNILCKLLGKTLGENISGIPESEREKFCEWLLRNQYEDANERLATVQRFLDEKQNIHIEPQKAKFPAERVRQAAHSLEDKTVSEEVIQRRAENAVANIANSFHDDYIKENAKFRNNAGLKTYITRSTNGKCCEWCTRIAGRYEYGKHPKDIFRKHDNCDCIVIYENGRQRTNVWTKKSWNAPEISSDALKFKPARFTPEQARQTEREKIQYRGLTNSGGNGTIESSKSSLNPMSNGIQGSAFISASDVSAAETYARDVLGIPNVYYTGLDAETANEMNQALYESFRDFPELRKQIQFAGTCQERNRLLEEKATEYYTKLLENRYSGQGLEEHVAVLVEWYMSDFSILQEGYAQSFSRMTIDNLPDFPEMHGIAINADFGRDSSAFRKTLQNDVAKKHHPDGCDTIKSAVDHEIGHQLDALLGIREMQEIKNIYEMANIDKTTMTQNLSGYSFGRINETIAEAWSEYRNNPSPRYVAESIGNVIKENYDRRFKSP